MRSRIEVYTRVTKATGNVYSGVPEYRTKVEHLGQASTRREPQIGHVLIFDNNTYRIKDIAHPTDKYTYGGEELVPPMVLVEVDVVPWLDGLK